jgi:hypothetical protein
VTRELGKPIKEARQMTAAMPAGAAFSDAVYWPAIDWQKAHRNVRRLQGRIVKAWYVHRSIGWPDGHQTASGNGRLKGMS